MTVVHHSAICTTDVDTSLTFWRDGLGFEVQLDRSFDGDWPTLFDAPSDRLRSVFLGHPEQTDAGIVELVDFGGGPEEPAPPTGPARGFFLLSIMTDLDVALDRLAELGVGGEPRVITVDPGVRMAVVRDPNGVLVELIDVPGSANLERLSDAGADAR